MWTYRAPLRDIEFVINEWLHAQAEWETIPNFAELDQDTVEQIVTSAGQFAAEVVAPINSPGDIEGCHYDNGKVTTPKHYRETYQAYVEAGWPALACETEFGGQGLPQLLNCALYEMLVAACHAWAMYPGLAHGAYECIRTHGTDSLKAQYLPKLVNGEWLATMCLTEAHAGTDLGLLRTRAEPDDAASGRYRISGTKIFISGGEHDLTDNIVHLVLARLPGAPAGSKGISLFLVPKLLLDGQANAVRCDGIEKKMGIKGSATCVLTFAQASGWIIGEPNRGLAAMFVMMNAARLHVGLQGLSHAEAAYQNALHYALERKQMRVPTSTDKQGATADLIVKHPPMRRILLQLRAFVQGQRALAYWIAHLLDCAEHHSDAAQRQASMQLVSLLTPMAKGFFTDNGFVLSSAALQVFGGHGYVHENAIEQTVRDSRIAMLYEGTNEIQAIDLVARKIIGDRGAAFDQLLKLIAVEVQACNAVSACATFGQQLQATSSAVSTVVAMILRETPTDRELPYRIADDFMRAFGLLMLAFAWARTARIAQARAEADDFYKDKLVTAHFCFDFVLPELHYRLELVNVAWQGVPQIEVRR